jgi:hypothetical protein
LFDGGRNAAVLLVHGGDKLGRAHGVQVLERGRRRFGLQALELGTEFLQRVAPG